MPRRLKAAVRITVRGVRSSCETPATKFICWSASCCAWRESAADDDGGEGSGAGSPRRCRGCACGCGPPGFEQRARWRTRTASGLVEVGRTSARLVLRRISALGRAPPKPRPGPRPRARRSRRNGYRGGQRMHRRGLRKCLQGRPGGTIHNGRGIGIVHDLRVDIRAAGISEIAVQSSGTDRAGNVLRVDFERSANRLRAGPIVAPRESGASSKSVEPAEGHGGPLAVPKQPVACRSIRRARRRNIACGKIEEQQDWTSSSALGTAIPMRRRSANDCPASADTGWRMRLHGLVRRRRPYRERGHWRQWLSRRSRRGSGCSDAPAGRRAGGSSRRRRFHRSNGAGELQELRTSTASRPIEADGSQAESRRFLI